MQNQVNLAQNDSFVSQGPISYPSGKTVKNLYKNELLQQMDQKKQKQFEEKQNDRHQDVKMLVGNQMNDWFGRQGNGAPVRDHQGNIQTSRKNPQNPNYQGQNWFGGGQGYIMNNQQQVMQQQQQQIQQQQQQLNQQQQYQQQIPQYSQIQDQAQYNSSMPPISRQQQNPPSRLMHQNHSMINLQMPPMDTIQSVQNLQSQQILQGMLSQSQIITKPPVDAIAELQKRQRQLELQRELQQQMDDKKRKKDDEKYNSKRDRELEDRRVEREREQIERRMIEDVGQLKLESRNLNQTNFDADKFSTQKRLQMLKYQNDLLEQQNLKNTQHDGRRRVRTPVRDADNAYLDEMNAMTIKKIEQRVIQELPYEMERTVKETINFELQRLRAEMHLQTNSVAEQLVQLKGQIIKSNESKHQNDEQVRRLREELKQTQIVDEIRQRELYQAFMGSKKNQIFIDGTDRLLTPDTFGGFNFPQRPRPYYNLSDPYFGNQDEISKDIHGMLHDSTHLIPLNPDNDWISLTKKNHVTLQDNEDDNLRLAKRVDVEVELPEDYYNRQKLYIPQRQLIATNKYDYLQNPDDKMGYEYIAAQNSRIYKDDIVSIIGTTNQQYILEEDEIKNVLRRYEEKYQQLDQIEANQGTGQLERRDDALFDLMQQQTSKYESKETPKPFEYNDYYSTNYKDDDRLNYKIGSIYAK